MPEPALASPTLPNLTIEAAYRERTPGSAALAARAADLFPSGVTHDGRYLKPYGIYVERAAGAYKWDVDGNRYIDYFGGHGALLLGHDHPAVIAAAQAALARGTHFGASHPLEVRWAEAVRRLMPCGRAGTLHLLGHRGDPDGGAARPRLHRPAQDPPLQDPLPRLARPHDLGLRRPFRRLAHTRRAARAWPRAWCCSSPTMSMRCARRSTADDDIAAVMIEPTGGSFGMTPLAPGFLAALRELTAARRVLLIFDEVITGFRVAPGGAQAHFGITPDLTTLAKIVAGGLPGGAVVGRAEVLERLDFERAGAAGYEKIQHPGTFNANPVSAAAGAAALEVIATSDACARANAAGAALRARLNEVLEAEGVPWAAYGTFSGLHLFTNPKGRALRPSAFDPLAIPYAELKTRQGAIGHRLRVAMLVQGVDLNNWPGALLSAALSEADLADTADAFREALRMLKREGDLVR